MPRITILSGLPASGKSTKAKEMLKEGNCVRVNKDLLRTMLHFDKFSGNNEKLTVNTQVAIVKEILSTSSKNVIIDDTNLNKKVVDRWNEVANEHNTTCEYIFIDTPVEECVARDASRPDMVGKSVIINMARTYGLYPFDRKEIIVDIDGTLADISHRKHFVLSEPKKWKEFFELCGEDKPRDDVYAKVMEMKFEHDADIILVSGRPEEYRKTTEEWLDKHSIQYTTLIMRPSGDSRPDTVIKENILNKFFKKENIVMAFDDRPRIIRMWESHGIKVEDVGDGIEF